MVKSVESITKNPDIVVLCNRLRDAIEQAADNKELAYATIVGALEIIKHEVIEE